VSPVRRGRIDPDDASLAWEAEGEGPPVVLVHGFTLDRRLWDDLVPVLAPRFTVVRYDLRGHGGTPPPRGPYRHADDLARLLDALGLDRPALVGLSLGGGVVGSFAVAHPGRARALVLVESSLGGFRYPPEFEAALASVAATARRDGPAAAREEWLRLPLLAAARAHPAAGPKALRMIRDYSGWHWTNPDPGIPLDPPAAQRLGEIREPCLIVAGERSLPEFHRIAAILERGIPGARKVVLPGVGHLPNLEDPDRFGGLVLDFLLAHAGATSR
jgi:pimeloyl-ACP methyl ester carboxylesterase